MTAAVLIPVGEEASHRAGLADLLEALPVYEPDTGQVVVVCERVSPELERVLAAAPLRVEVMANPRRGRGVPLLGGAVAGTLAGLAAITTRTPAPEVVVKLDTDALVIAPCFAHLATLFAERPRAGIAGAHRLVAGRVPRDFAAVGATALRVARPISLWRGPSGTARVRCAAIPRHGRVRGWLRRALRAGWEPGEHCQGGAYAMSVGLLAALHEAGALARPEDWIDVPLGEDHVLGALTFACGYELVGMTNEGEPFGVAYRHLPGTGPEMVARGHAIVHSLKADIDGRPERELRAYFAARLSDARSGS